MWMIAANWRTHSPSRWLGLRVGGHPALSLHSPNEPGELLQWLLSWWQHHKHCRGYYYYYYSYRYPDLPSAVGDITVQLPMYADNMVQPARCSWLISARRAHSSKHAAAGLLMWTHAGTDQCTDRQMDTVPFHRPCSAYYTGSANN